MALQCLMPFTTWLASTPLSLMMGEITWIVPAVQSVHIMAISVVAGSALIVDLHLIGAFDDGEGMGAVTRRCLPWLWWALLVLLLTGVIMVTGEPRRSLQNSAFILKMGLVLMAVGLTASMQLPVKKNANFWQDRKPLARFVAIASLCIWGAIIFCGRWIAYNQEL